MGDSLDTDHGRQGAENTSRATRSRRHVARGRLFLVIEIDQKPSETLPLEYLDQIQVNLKVIELLGNQESRLCLYKAGSTFLGPRRHGGSSPAQLPCPS